MDIIKVIKSKVINHHKIYDTGEQYILLQNLIEKARLFVISHIVRLNARLKYCDIYLDQDIAIFDEWKDKDVYRDKYNSFIDIIRHYNYKLRNNIEEDLIILDKKIQFLDSILQSDEICIQCLKDSWLKIKKILKTNKNSSDKKSETFFTQYLRNISYEKYGLYGDNRKFVDSIIKYYIKLLCGDKYNISDYRSEHHKYMIFFGCITTYNLIERCTNQYCGRITHNGMCIRCKRKNGYEISESDKKRYVMRQRYIYRNLDMYYSILEKNIANINKMSIADIKSDIRYNTDCYYYWRHTTGNKCFLVKHFMNIYYYTKIRNMNYIPDKEIKFMIIEYLVNYEKTEQ